MNDQSTDSGRYRSAAITLHWIMAALILTQFFVAAYMGSQPDDSVAQDNVEKVHVSIGLTIFLFAVARLVVRLMYRAPPLPAGVPQWQRGLAKASHMTFYFLILAIPLTGWSLKSFFPRPISFWGFEGWPRLPWFSSLPPEQGAPLYGQVESFHGAMAGLLMLLLLLHVGAALLHQFKGPPVLWRMLPFMRRPPNL